jgi:hypothetical protein
VHGTLDKAQRELARLLGEANQKSRCELPALRRGTRLVFVMNRLARFGAWRNTSLMPWLRRSFGIALLAACCGNKAPGSATPRPVPAKIEQTPAPAAQPGVRQRMSSEDGHVEAWPLDRDPIGCV